MNQSIRNTRNARINESSCVLRNLNLSSMIRSNGQSRRGWGATARAEEDGNSAPARTGSFSALRRTNLSRKERWPAMQAGTSTEEAGTGAWEVASPISTSEVLLSPWEEDMLKAKV
ncbi:hypothetical protein DY000_02040190 [Brassica cretica]|uniref:Remorin C-terminal domain-containing protein n=1 Tax=Brassica cretica TaxID=69181 RepID=A0ABQ7B5K9_BRACR|nr:hypothetical protein DY000_02040190 [Brassica cretica]